MDLHLRHELLLSIRIQGSKRTTRIGKRPERELAVLQLRHAEPRDRSQRRMAHTCRWFYYDNSSGYTGTLPSGIALTNQYGHLVEATTDACVAVVSHTSSTIITDEWFAYDKDGQKPTSGN